MNSRLMIFTDHLNINQMGFECLKNMLTGNVKTPGRALS